MTDLSPAYGLSYASKARRSKTPEDVMRDIVDGNQGSDEEKLEEFCERILRSKPLTEICVKGFGVNILRSLRRLESSEVIEKKRAEREATKAHREKVITKAVAETFSWMAQTVFGLTFGEVGKLAKASPALTKIARMGKPDQHVSDVLTLGQLTKMLPK